MAQYAEDAVLRITGEREKKSLLEFSGKWTGDDVDEVFAHVKKDREQSTSRQADILIDS